MMHHERRRLSILSRPLVHLISVRKWQIWTLSWPVRWYVLLVISAALVAATTTVHLMPVDKLSLIWFSALAAAAAIHLEVSRSIERMRELATAGTTYAHLQSIWVFAALLLLPPPLVLVLIVLNYGHTWLRVHRPPAVLYRLVFSASTVVIGCWCAGAVIMTVYPDAAGPLVSKMDGPQGLAVLVTAALAYWLVNLGLVIAAIIFTSPDRSWRAAFGHLSDQLIIGASVGLGTAIAVMVTTQPWLTPVLMFTVLALNLGLLLPEFATATRTDQKTGLLNATFWHELAGKELERARSMRTTAGLLMIDIDHFGTIDDRYPNPVSDHVLRAVGAALRAEARGEDWVGRFGEEFVVLLPGVDSEQLGEVADRICQRIRKLEVEVDTGTDQDPIIVRGLTASVGAALHPQMAATLEELLWAADNALFAAKDGGRDQVRMVRSTPLH